jgi:effector-binding domain-containing protein
LNGAVSKTVVRHWRTEGSNPSPSAFTSVSIMEIREIEPQVAAIKRISTTAADLPGVIDKTFPSLFGELASKNVEPVGPPFVRYLDTGDEMEVELGVPIPHDTSPSAVKSVTLPAGPTAVYVYVGAYDGLRDAWKQFGEWVERQGREQDGPFWESYVSDPREVPDPAMRITELYMPLR